MADKLEVLEFLLNRKNANLAVNYQDLVDEFWLSASGACRWLSRLEDQGLIQYKFTSQKKRFYTLAERGLERLKWLRKEKSSWGGF